jgi:hypothetical protein
MCEHTGLTPDLERINFIFHCTQMEYDNDDIKDPYITELELNVSYYQEHLNFYQNLLQIYRKEGDKAADNYKKEHFNTLSGRPKFVPIVSGKRKSITSLKGEELLIELKTLLGDSADQTE